MPNQILVIGATGSIGTPLVEMLANRRLRVKAATRRPAEYAGPAKVTLVHFDYKQPATFAAALAGVDRIFMITPPSDFEPEQSLNPFIDQAQQVGVKHIVLVTAIGVERANPEMVYRRVELHLMASGVPYTILRPGWLMQSLATGYISSTIKQRQGIYLPAGDAQISYIDTYDIAAVAATALTEAGHEGKEYALTGGTALGFSETAAIISDAIDTPIQYVDVTIEELQQIVAEVGGWQGPIELMERFFRSAKRGSHAAISPDVSEVLGRAPTTLAQFAHTNAVLWQTS